jgi:hypothetical protein
MWDPQNERIRNFLLLVLNSKAMEDFVIRHSTESSILDPESLTEDHLKNLLFTIITFGDILEAEGKYKAASFYQNGIRFYLLWSEDTEREFVLKIEKQLSIFQKIKKIFKIKVLKRAGKPRVLDTRVLSVTWEEGVPIDSIIKACFNW